MDKPTIDRAIRILEAEWAELGAEYANASVGRKGAITRRKNEITHEIGQYERYAEAATG